MKRRKHSKLISVKDQNITCNGCSKTFSAAQHFKLHFIKNPQCKAAQHFRCSGCRYIGHNERSLITHIQMNESCSYFEKQKEITTGLLPVASSAGITQNEISANLLSYTFKRYSTDGIVDNVQLNLKDDTRVKRRNVRKVSDRQGLSCNLNSYMTNSRAVAGVQENHFSSNFLLENNHHIVDNQFDMSQDCGNR